MKKIIPNKLLQTYDFIMLKDIRQLNIRYLIKILFDSFVKENFSNFNMMQ